jgi:hypothetical protein
VKPTEAILDEVERRRQDETDAVLKVLRGEAKEEEAEATLLGDTPLEENPDGDILDDAAVPEEHLTAGGGLLKTEKVVEASNVGRVGWHLEFVQKAGRPGAERKRLITTKRRKDAIICSKGLNGSTSPEDLARAIILNYLPAHSPEQLKCGQESCVDALSWLGLVHDGQVMPPWLMQWVVTQLENPLYKVKGIAEYLTNVRWDAPLLAPGKHFLEVLESRLPKGRTGALARSRLVELRKVLPETMDEAAKAALRMDSDAFQEKVRALGRTKASNEEALQEVRDFWPMATMDQKLFFARAWQLAVDWIEGNVHRLLTEPLMVLG